MNKLKVIFFSLVLGLSVNVYSQFIGSSGLSDPVSTGLGNTFVTRPDGVYSIGKNPANLAYFNNLTEFTFILPLPEVAFSAGTDFMNLEELNYFFGGNGRVNNAGETIGRYLTPNDISRFKGLFENGNEIDVNLSARYLSVVLNVAPFVGVFGFSITDRISAKTTIPKDLIDLMDGNEIGKIYSLSDLKMNSWAIRDYTLSFGKDISMFMPEPIKSLTIGASVKLVHGFAYSGIESANSSFQVNNDAQFDVVGDLKVKTAFSPDFGVEYDFDEGDKSSNINGPFPEPSGVGFGLDIGGITKIYDFWTFGLSITDIGSITWDKDVANYVTDTRFTLDGIFGKDDYSDLVDSSFKTLEPEGSYADAFTTTLPTALHLGASFELDKYLNGNFPGEMMLYAEYHQGLNDMPLNSLSPRFAFGADWSPIGWFNFRTGLSFGGIEGFNLASGLGFNAGILKIDLATNHLQGWLNGNGAERLSFAMGSRWCL